MHFSEKSLPNLNCFSWEQPETHLYTSATLTQAKFENMNTSMIPFLKKDSKQKQNPTNVNTTIFFLSFTVLRGRKSFRDAQALSCPRCATGVTGRFT